MFEASPYGPIQPQLVKENLVAKKEKVEYAKPTSQTDLEARIGEDAPERLYEDQNPGPDSVLNGTEKNDSNKPAYATASGDDYVGTDPIYQNHGEDHLKPFAATEGVEKTAEDAYFDSMEKGNEAGSQLVGIYGDKTVHSQGSTVTEAQASGDGDSSEGDGDNGDGGESTDSTNADGAAKADNTNPASSTQS